MWSQSQPMMRRATIVIATEAMMAHLICDLESASSSRITGMSGATPNQAKKQRKNASHDMWNARICGISSRKKFRQSDVHLSAVAAGLDMRSFSRIEAAAKEGAE